jgi:hypothetical protein
VFCEENFSPSNFHLPVASTRWQRSGSQGNQWQQMHLGVVSTHNYQIIIRGTVGGYQGDIAVDDISFDQGACITSDASEYCVMMMMMMMMMTMMMMMMMMMMMTTMTMMMMIRTMLLISQSRRALVILLLLFTAFFN